MDSIIEDINNIILVMKKGKLEQITIIIADAWKFKFYRLFMSLFKETVDQGKIIKRIMQEKDLKPYGKVINQAIAKIIKNIGKYYRISLTIEEEHQFFQQIKPNLENKCQCAVLIQLEQETKAVKANQALPGKPAIVIS